MIAGVGALAGVAVAGVTGLELVAHGVVPGRQELDQIEGDCSVQGPPLRSAETGPSRSGTFYSRWRRRRVGYTIAWPPGHQPGSALALVVMLHGFGGNHTNALAAISPTQALALEIDGRPLPPLAMVTVDGGGGYWNPHPGDDPMAMMIDELIPLCQQLASGSLRTGSGRWGSPWAGMAHCCSPRNTPTPSAAVAAISPAMWTTYAQAQAANAGAYASAADFAEDDVGHPCRCARTDTRSGWRRGRRSVSPRRAWRWRRHCRPARVVDVSQGCHTGPFFTAQEPPSLRFLAAHLGS